jgi:rod shape-determining protein MreC
VAKPRRSRRPRTTLIILVLVSITIITLDARGGLDRVTSGMRSVAEDVFSPIRSGVDGIVQPIGSFLAGSVHYGAVRQQNQKLEAENGRLRAQIAGQADAAQALQQLKQLSALDDLPYYANLQLVPAEVIDYDSSDFAATIDIDVGRDQGATLDMPVVGEGGLIGQIVQANANTSTVRMITDGQSKVGARYGTGSLALLNGQGADQPLTASYVPPNTPVADGDIFTTSGLQGALFPPGIPVARVETTRTGTTSSEESVTLAPLADLDHLRYVSVVLWGPQS